jgi:hypothetical protein
LISEHSQAIENLAKELLLKETLDLLDIVRILGERPFPLSESMKDYYKEIENKKNPDSVKDNVNNEEDVDKKSDEFDQDRDLNDNDSGNHGLGKEHDPEPRGKKEVKEAETVIKSYK